MGIIPTLNTFVAGTPIVASAMNSNFEAIVTAVNGGLDDSNISQISAEKVTSGEFDPDRIPRLSEAKLPQAAQGFLKAKGVAADPAYELVQWGDVQAKPAQATRWPTWGEVTSKPSTYPPSAHNHGAGDINSGRLELARLPTSGTANRFLKVGTANSTPAYSTVTWNDVQSKPSTYPPSAHSHARGDLPVGATNNTQVAPGQAMTGSGSARHPVGSMRLLVHTSESAQVFAGDSISGSSLRLAYGSTVITSAIPSSFFERGADSVPGTWQALSSAASMPSSAPEDRRNPFLAVRIS